MFKGSIVALITPMDATARVEYERLPAMLERLIEAGSSGVVVAGTTGESASLSPDEFRQLLSVTRQVCAGRIPVLAGTGAASTLRTIEQTCLAQECGADAALIVTPYYYRPTPAGLKAHYEAVVAATDLPIVLYNVPSRTAVDLPVNIVAELSKLEQIVAIKEATPGSQRIEALIKACGGRLAILSGDDGSCAESMLAGASGVISVAANVAPGHMAELCESALEGKTTHTMALHSGLAELFRQLGIETNPIPVKCAAEILDLAGPGIRLPLLPLEEHYREGLRACLKQLGLLARTEP